MTYAKADGDDTAGWAPWFGGSGGFRSSDPGENGIGQSLHITAFSSASVALEFHGKIFHLLKSTAT